MSIPKEIKKISAFSDEDLQHYFNTQPLKSLHAIRAYARDIYDNTDKPTGLTDWQYDMLADTLKRRDPNYVMPVGSKVRSGKNRVKLPYWLGSMDKMKMKPEFQDMTLTEMKGILSEEKRKLPDLHGDELRETRSRIEKIQQQIAQLRFLQKWLKNNKSPYIMEDKLDGVSCLLTHEGGQLKLYTRGDGIVGADISYLAQFFDTVPKNLTKNISVRGELIMPVDIFKKKYASDYANPRNLVAGRTGAKTVRKGIKDIKFIAYEIVGKGKMPKPSDQFKRLTKLGFTVVKHKRVNTVTASVLAKAIIEWKENSPYEIDGLIIQSDRPYIRNTRGNPAYAFAFKMRIGDNVVDAKVVSVLWAMSKWGQLKPRVKIEPVRLMGTTVTYASGKNAKFIHSNRIGPGAIVKVTKGGEVIPDIIGIVKRASSAQMPKSPCEWKWNKTKVDILAVSGCGGICTKLMFSFLQQMGFKNVGQRTVERLYEGGVDSILRILTVTHQQLREVGFGARQSEVILNSIKETLGKGMNLARMLGSSGVFGQGVGKKTVATLLKYFPNILEEQKVLSEEELYQKIVGIPGFGAQTAKTAAKNLPWAAKFAEMMGYLTTFTTTKRMGGPLKGYTVVISGTLPGYSRKQAQAAVEEAGGETSNSVKKPQAGLKQIVVIVGAPTTKKAKDARKHGIRTYNADEFNSILNKGPSAVEAP